MSIFHKKVWVARDEDNQLRLYMRKPTWVYDGLGYWKSSHPNWQIPYTMFDNVDKGESELVKMIYSLEEIYGE